MLIISIALVYCSWAVDSIIYRDSDDFGKLINRLTYFSRPGSHDPYQSARQILVLSDGAKGTRSNFAKKIKSNVSPDAWICSAGIANGESISVNVQNKMAYRRVDNTQPEDFRVFKNKQFDLISFRGGLCPCQPLSRVACGGFVAGTPESKRFFTEMIRVLNVDNPSAIALAFAFMTPSRISPMLRCNVSLEKENEEILTEELAALETEHPEIKILKLYHLRPVQTLNLPSITNTILNDLGGPLSEHDTVVHFFTGIAIVPTNNSLRLPAQ